MKPATNTPVNPETQIEEWKKKYGILYELEADEKKCIIFDPMSSLKIMKQLMTARRKSKGDQVDALLANCWLSGDDSIKGNDRFKLGIEDQVDELFDIPDHTITETTDGFVVKVEDKKLEVRKAGRGDIAYAEARNADNKPFTTAEFLIERIALNKPELDEIKKDNRIYLAILLAASELKDKVYVGIKKL
jgi:hypothetical protein